MERAIKDEIMDQGRKGNKRNDKGRNNDERSDQG